MATVRQDLTRRLRERLERELGTMLPPGKLDEIAESLTVDMVEWLQRIYDDHTLTIEVAGDSMPEVVRPSLTWLTEAVRS